MSRRFLFKRRRTLEKNHLFFFYQTQTTSLKRRKNAYFPENRIFSSSPSITNISLNKERRTASNFFSCCSFHLRLKTHEKDTHYVLVYGNSLEVTLTLV
jgi:hypothetical protein